MHPNPAFHWSEKEELRAFVARRGFATLCVATSDGPAVAHVPLVAHADTLQFHLARTNRITPHLDGATVVASVLDADFYVSPDWYASEDQVPTWNYLVVEIEGIVRRLSREALVEQVDRLSSVFEETLAPKPAWTRDKMTPARFEAMLSSIQGFELVPTTWRGTRKMGQNKKPAERAALASMLTTRGSLREADMVRRT